MKFIGFRISGFFLRKGFSAVFFSILIGLLSNPPALAQINSGTGTSYSSSTNTGDPVSAANGAFKYSLELDALGGPMELGFALHYRSDFQQLIYNSGNGNGLPFRFWYSPYGVLEYHYDDEEKGPFATAQVDEGDVVSFKLEQDEWVPAESGDFGKTDNVYPFRWQLVETTGYFYLMDPLDQLVYIFKKVVAPSTVPGLCRLERIEGRNDTAIVFEYAESDDFNPSRVADGLGRYFDLSYSTVGSDTALVSVSDQQDREIVFTHESSGADNWNLWTLRSVADAAGGATTFQYTTVGFFPILWTDLITQVQRPKGNIPYTQSYDSKTLNGESYARVVSQTDADGNATTFSYSEDSQIVTETRADGAVVVYEHYDARGLPKTITDPEQNATQTTRDLDANHILTITDRVGSVTTYAYHEDTGKLSSVIDDLGNVTTISYTAASQTFSHPDDAESAVFTFYDLTGTVYADGSTVARTYDATGNAIANKDRLGGTWTFAYNAQGLMTGCATPSGNGEFAWTYNADGTMATSTDSDTGVVAYEYDEYKRLKKITRPDGKTSMLVYNLRDQPTSLTDELDRVTTLAYDDNGNLLSMTDPEDETITFTYDSMDRLKTIVNQENGTTTMEYEMSDRMSSITDPNDNVTTFDYDLHGRIGSITDPAGHATTFDYDAEGRPVKITTPLGNEYEMNRDDLGRVTSAADPLDAVATQSWDSLHRIDSIADRAGRTVDYAYDGGGFIQSLTRSGLGPVAYVRNEFGNVASLTDPEGGVWSRTHTPMGRLLTFADPLGRTWSFSYDQRGQRTGATFPDASTVAHGFDDAGFLIQQSFSDGTVLDFTYDDASRMDTAGDLAFEYDGCGALTRTAYADAAFVSTYDAVGRMETVSYDELFDVTYSYDSRGLLSRVEDDLSGSWMTFSYDADRRLTTISRSNGTATSFARDAAGRVTAATDTAGPVTLGQQSYTLNAEGEPVGASCSLPLDPAAPSDQKAFSYDAACQIADDDYDFDDRGRRIAAPGASYTWDGASRLITATAGGQTATFSYDDLNHPFSRTTGGTTTTWYRHYALELAPVLAEKEDGAYKRFYVYEPNGRLLYSIGPTGDQARFYHFDRVGSTLFLTDSDGGVADAYAYDPYGNIQNRTGSSDQPFTYVGRFGVRREPTGEMYAMGVRYYDPGSHHFLSRDPLWGTNGFTDNLNPYLYAASNPLRYIDPGGLSFQTPEDNSKGKSSPSSGDNFSLPLVNSGMPKGSYLSLYSRQDTPKSDLDGISVPKYDDSGDNTANPDESSFGHSISGGSFVDMDGVLATALTSYNYYSAGKTIYQVAVGKAHPYAVIAEGIVGWIDALRHAYTWYHEGSGAAQAQQGIIETAVGLAVNASPSDTPNTPVGNGLTTGGASTGFRHD